jgi:hypothetical protein
MKTRKPQTATRRTMTQPDDWWEAFEKEAARTGHTLSEWVGNCCRRQLRRSISDRLSERRPAHRPPAEETLT